jgi:uncharacterized membrane protein
MKKQKEIKKHTHQPRLKIKILAGFSNAGRFTDLIAFLSFVLFTLAGILVSLNRFWQYEVSYIDFGQYDQAIWKISRFQEPLMYHFIHGKINVLGDHVTPSIFLLASPFYWLTNRSEIILIIQALAVGLSGLVLYDIAKTILKNKFLSLSIVLSYFLFVGLQNAVITEFHELTVMTLPFMLTVWALIKNKIPLYFIFLLITLGCKEVTFALGICLGIAFFLLKKEWRKIGVATILISALWGIIAFKVIIPYFSHGQYLYATAIPGGILEKIQAFVDKPQKRHTLIFSFLSFSGLPIFAPQFWLTILQDYAGRFLPQNFATRWDLGMHYNAESAVILAIASIFGLKYLLKFAIIKKYALFIALLITLNALFLFRFVLHGPFLLATNAAFYQQTKDFAFLDKMIKQIPPQASVMTQNNLATRFTHQDVRLLTSEYPIAKPQYIVIDLRQGQNPNNYFGSGDIEKIYKQLVNDANYTLIYQTKEQFIFKHK